MTLFYFKYKNILDMKFLMEYETNIYKTIRYNCISGNKVQNLIFKNKIKKLITS